MFTPSSGRIRERRCVDYRCAVALHMQKIELSVTDSTALLTLSELLVLQSRSGRQTTRLLGKSVPERNETTVLLEGLREEMRIVRRPLLIAPHAFNWLHVPVSAQSIYINIWETSGMTSEKNVLAFFSSD